MSDVAAGRVIAPYGWVEWIERLGIILLIVLTIFMCQTGNNGHIDVHIVEFNNPPTVTATLGFISAHIEPTTNGNSYRLISDSSVSVDAIGKAQDGRVLFTVNSLPPGGFVYVEPTEPCTVTVVAS